MLQKAEQNGGRVRYGWAIWEWPRVFIEAEHHAVYEAPDGSLHDITPSVPEDPQTARLFLRDDTAVYDFGNPNGPCRDNIRQPLAEDAQIREYLQVAEDISAILMSIPGSGMVEVSDPVIASRLESLMKKSARLKREIAQRFTSQNAPCYCGSGQKFKRCHGEPRRRKS